MNDIREISARHAARRYAEMLVEATAATERIAELQKRVEDAEYFRHLAEAQLEAATWPEGVGEILHAGTEAPGEEVYGLIDLYSGQVYRRAEGESGMWLRAEASASGATRYDWPIEEAGPFLKLQDEWYVRKVIDAVRADDERRLKLRNRFRGERGYYPEGENQYTWNQIDPADGAIRAYNDLWSRFCELGAETHEIKAKLAAADREIVRLNAEAEAKAA